MKKWYGYAVWGIAVLGIIASIAAYFPGLMTNDSFLQLEQARTGIFSDLHPPVMAFVWRFVDMVVAGPFGMLVLQTTIYWGAIALIMWHLWHRHWVTPLAIAIIGFWSPSFSMLGFIWKDIQMTASFAMAIALTLLAIDHKRQWPLVPAMVFLLYGTALRHNAVFAAFPIVVWWGWLLTSNLKPLILRGAAVIVITIGMMLVPRMITPSLATVHVHPSQQLFLYDLAGISVLTDNNLLPLHYQPFLLPVRTLKEKYNPTHVGCFLWGSDTKTNLLLSPDSQAFEMLKKQWLHAVLGHKKAYLQHRLDVFATQLGWGPYRLFSYLKPTREYRADCGVSWDPSRFSRGIFDYYDRIQDSILFKPYLYLIILLGSFAFSLRGALKRERLPLLAMVFSLSGLMNLCPYFLISIGFDLRFSHWSIVCACLALAVLVKYYHAGRNPAVKELS